MDALILPEQLLLLAFYEEKANTLNTSLGFGLSGAVLAELLVQGKIERKGINLVPRSDVASDDEILDPAFAILTASERQRSARYWVNHLYPQMLRLRPKLLDRLSGKGYLTESGTRIFGVFPHRSYRLADVHGPLALKDELRQVLFEPFAPTARQVALIGLMKPAGLNIFTREERGAARARISEMLRSDPISKAVSQAVAEMAGTAAAVIACAAAASA